MSEEKREPNHRRSALPQGRPQFISDIRLPAKRDVDLVGKTLPLYRSLPDSRSVSFRSTPRSQNPQIQTSLMGRQRSAALPQRPQLRPSTAPSKKRRKLFTKRRLLIALIIIVLAAGGWLGFKFVSNALKVFNGNILSVLTTTKLRGEDLGRVNILLAGNSADDPGHQGGELTDSIMIVSVDTKNHSATLLSVPRDLWVSIPGDGHAKINETYVDGKANGFSESGYANGGMGLLEKVVEQDFGIHINYYALVNYNALRDAVNAVGGIDINIQSKDSRGLYDPSIDYATHGPLVRLSNGVHHLDGQQALDLARARGDAYGQYGFSNSDFDRTEHQRQILVALKTQAISAGVLANPARLGSLFDSVGKNVTTDFNLGEARRLYDTGKGIDNSNVRSASLNDADGKNLLDNYAAPNGSSALIPALGVDNFTDIKAFVQRLTSNDPVVRENAGVVVLNGTDVLHLATKVSQRLVAKNVRIVAVDDAKSLTDVTTIIDVSNGKKPATLKVLKSLYGSHVVTANPYKGVYNASFILVVGGDQGSAG